MSYFSWLHLTDLHLKKESEGRWSALKEIFFKDLERLHEKSGPWDLVLFTGNLTFQGSDKEFRHVDEVLMRIKS